MIIWVIFALAARRSYTIKMLAEKRRTGALIASLVLLAPPNPLGQDVEPPAAADLPAEFDAGAPLKV